MEVETRLMKSKKEDYEVLKQIARGVYGATFLAHHKVEKRRYVIKKIGLAKETETLNPATIQEMNTMVKLENPYIARYKDAWVDEGMYVCIVMDYCAGGDMADTVRKARGAYFSEETLCKWLTQLLLGVDYLHSHRILHGDLKCSNILLTRDKDVRLGDFGLVKLLSEEDLASSAFGTPTHMCPELIASLPYGYKSDIWSLGCCMFEIASHQPPFRAPDMAGIINKINRGTLSPLPLVYSSTLKQIIKSMLRKSPEHRPTAAELLRHPHLQPYVLVCHSPSTVFLPIKPTNSPNEKTRKSSARRLSGGRTSAEMVVRILEESADILPHDDENDLQLFSSLTDDIQTLTTIEDDNLETKRVDPTSYAATISDTSEDAKSDKTAKSEKIKEPLLVEDSSETPVKCTSSVENGDACTDPSIDCVSSETNDKHECKDEDIVQKIDEEPRNVSITEAVVCSYAKKCEKDNPNGQQRAAALESLLELCARLLKQNRLDELAAVLKPFGEETVSSRETAIWLTKSLMTLQASAEAKENGNAD